MNKFELLESFGPRIARVKLSKEETKELYQICLNSQKDARDGLVGYIKEEVHIHDQLKDSKVSNTISHYVDQYVKTIDSGRYKKILKENNFDSICNLRSAWYNKQVAMEYNPIHSHSTTADIVTVLYPKIKLDTDVEYYKVNSTTNSEQKGQIVFVHGQDMNTNGFGLYSVDLEPEEGDLLIFPGSTLHYTAPVLGNSVRYSISCNWVIHNHLKRMASKNE